MIIALAVLCLLGWHLVRNWRQIPFEQIRFDYRFILLSFVCMFGFFSNYVLAWRLILRSYGFRVGFADCYRILAVSNLGKYLPGKVWFAVGRMYLARRFAVPERVSIVSTLLETFLLGISACMIAVSTIAAPWGGSLSLRASVVVMGVVVLGLFVTHPAVFERLVNLVLRRLGRPPVQMSLSYCGIVGLLVLYCLSWFWQGLGFFFLVKSFYDIRVSFWPILWGIYALAWMTGFVNILTPAGLGVREGIMSFLLSLYMATSMAVIVALVTRVWSTLVDVSFFLSSLVGLKRWWATQVNAEGN
jgi:uncharacterized membrane protein YbhN (UPF0104 family)